MPTILPSNEKADFISIVKAAPYPGGPSEADRLQSVLNYYEDVHTAIYRQLELFASNNSYLISAITVFNDNQLQLVGIFVNKSQSSPPITDPVLIINSDYTTVDLTPNVSSPPAEKTLGILGSSHIGAVVLDSNTVLDQLYIGPGSTVDVYDGSAGISSPPLSPPVAARVGTIWLPKMKSKPSALNSVVYGSMIGQVVKDEGSYYGGIAENPTETCADAVTAMAATEITKDAVLVSWTPPAQYLFINTFFRKTNSQVWILATTEDGDFVDDSGFIFRHLEAQTFYDFKATVICSNGGQVSTQITTETICCGGGTNLTIYDVCPITMIISSTPDSPPAGQVLCNGISIDLNYPPGATITIPYLASVNARILNPFVVGHSGGGTADSYQNFPYDSMTGTWDATSTSLGTFVVSNLVTVSVGLPRA